MVEVDCDLIIVQSFNNAYDLIIIILMMHIIGLLRCFNIVTSSNYFRLCKSLKKFSSRGKGRIQNRKTKLSFKNFRLDWFQRSKYVFFHNV